VNLSIINSRGDAVLIYSKKKVTAARAIEALFAIVRSLFLPRKILSAPPEAPLIVLIEPFQLGDVLALAVMLDPILERFPHARIVLWCHSKNAHAFHRDPRIWKTIHAPFPWSNRGSKRGTWRDWKFVLHSIREVRSHHPDAAIDPRGDIRSQLAILLARCNWRIGYTTYVGSNLRLRGLLLSHPLADPPATHRYLTNLFTLQPLLSRVPELRLPALPIPTAETQPRTVLLHPGAGWIYRRWPQDRWIALIEKLQQVPALRLIQIAGQLELAEEINRTLAQPIETRSTTYSELLTLISEASLFICLDSGPMQAAVLMNIPVLALFGPGESKVWRPLSARSRFFHHIEDYPCHPCTQITCVRPNDSCMTTIRVDEVFAAAQSILAGEPAPLHPTSFK
jgi:ADP-heptose:LPS heptosyltransferase